MTVEQDVCMGINEARDHKAVVQINDICVSWDLCIIEGANVSDAIIGDNHTLGKLIITLSRGRLWYKDATISEDRSHDCAMMRENGVYLIKTQRQFGASRSYLMKDEG
jgi:hypothetical protein